MRGMRGIWMEHIYIVENAIFLFSEGGKKFRDGMVVVGNAVGID